MAGKRAPGDGSIFQRGRRWRGQVTIGGERLSFSARTRNEVVDWIRKTTNQVEQGLTYKGAKTTFRDCLSDWLASRKSDLRPTTYKHYESICKIYLLPALGDVLVKDLTADQLQHIYDKWAANGTGAHTATKAHKVLHQVLKRAEENGLVYRNVSNISKPSKAQDKEMRFWLETEVNQFLTVIQSDRYYSLFYLAISTGMRQMELLGLKWQDLNWTRGTLHVSRQLSRSGGVFAEPKTKTAIRLIELGPGTINVLREHYKMQLVERHIVGEGWRDQDLIFTNKRGGPVDFRSLVIHHFKPLAKGAGVPEIRFHDMRHTAATIMLSHGIPPVIVAGRLGHKLATLMETYAHFIPTMQGEAARLMDDLISPIPVTIENRAQ